MAVTTKTLDNLVFRISTNVKNKTTTIVAYRKGRSKYPYKAVLPMCDKKFCHNTSPHTLGSSRRSGNAYYREVRVTSYHQTDVDNLVKKLIRSYR